MRNLHQRNRDRDDKTKLDSASLAKNSLIKRLNNHASIATYLRSISDPEFKPLLLGLCEYAENHSIGVEEYLETLACNLQTITKPSYCTLSTNSYYKFLAISSLSAMIHVVEIELELKALYDLEKADPLFDNNKLIMEAVLNSPTEDRSKLSFQSLADVLLRADFEDRLHQEIVTEIKTRVASNKSIGLLCKILIDNPFALVHRIEPLVEETLAEVFPYYRENAWNISQAILNLRLLQGEGNITESLWNKYSIFVRRCISLNTRIPNLDTRMLSHHEELSDQDLRLYHRISELALTDSDEILSPDVAIRESLLCNMMTESIYLGYSKTSSFLDEVAEQIGALPDHSLDSYRSLANDLGSNIYPLLALNEILEPLKDYYQDLDAALPSLRSALDDFFNPQITHNHRIRRPKIAVQTVKMLVSHYAENGWQIDAALNRFSRFGPNMMDVDFDTQLNTVVEKTCRAGLRFDGFNKEFIKQYASSQSPSETAFYNLYHNELAKLNKLNLTPEEHNRRADDIFDCLRILFLLGLRSNLAEQISKILDVDQIQSVDNDMLREKQRLINELVVTDFIKQARAKVTALYERNGWASDGLDQRLRSLCDHSLQHCSRPRVYDHLVERNPSLMDAFFLGLDQYTENNWPIEPLIRRFNNLQSQNVSFSPNLLRMSADKFKAHNIPFSYLSAQVITNAEKLRENHMIHLGNIIDHSRRKFSELDPSRPIDNTTLTLIHCAIDLARMESADYLFEKIIEGIERCNTSRVGEYLFELHRELRAHRATQLLAFVGNWKDLPPSQQDRFIAAKEVMASFTTDHVPYITPENEPLPPEAVRDLQQTHTVFRFAFDSSYGAKSLRYPCMRIGNQPAEIARFGLESGAKVFALNARDMDKPPGRGYLIAGLDPLLAFQPDAPLMLEERPTFSKYYQNWSFGRGIDFLADTQVYLTRSLIIGLTPPQVAPFIIEGRHYTLLIANIAFLNPFCEKLFAVPTEIWQSFFEGTMIPIADYSGPDPDFADLGDKNLSIPSLRRACKDENTSLLNLASGSNLYGTLVNSGMLKMPPFHIWERGRHREPRDLWGHVHKSQILGVSDGTMSSELEEMMQIARSNHAKVFEMADAFMNITMVLLKFIHLWRRGLTKTTNHSNYDHSSPMLQMAYEWHRHCSEYEGTLPHRPPVLYAQPELTLGRSPLRPLIDTQDLSIFDGEQWTKLPAWGTGNGDEELDLYRELVLAKLQPGEGLGFMDREFAGFDL